jgi:hypothetical protein
MTSMDVTSSLWSAHLASDREIVVRPGTVVEWRAPDVEQHALSTYRRHE